MLISRSEVSPRSLAVAMRVVVMAAEGGLDTERVGMRAERGIP